MTKLCSLTIAVLLLSCARGGGHHWQPSWPSFSVPSPVKNVKKMLHEILSLFRHPMGLNKQHPMGLFNFQRTWLTSNGTIQHLRGQFPLGWSTVTSRRPIRHSMDRSDSQWANPNVHGSIKNRLIMHPMGWYNVLWAYLTMHVQY